jgi:hypothetical protein
MRLPAGPLAGTNALRVGQIALGDGEWGRGRLKMVIEVLLHGLTKSRDGTMDTAIILSQIFSILAALLCKSDRRIFDHERNFTR